MTDKSCKMIDQADDKGPEVERQSFCFDLLTESDANGVGNWNQSNRADVIKKYLVYMELPKIKIGDYKKSSCVSGNIIRFHFLLRIARDESNTTLRLLPIKIYKAPVVNFAVIHRPFLDDQEAKGPIPKSPNVRSPLIRYKNNDDATLNGAPETRSDEIVEDFRRRNPDKSKIMDRPQQQESLRLSQARRDPLNYPYEAQRPSQARRDPQSDQYEVQRPSQARQDPLTTQMDELSMDDPRPIQTRRDPQTQQHDAPRPIQARRDPPSDQNEAQRPSQARRDPLSDQYDARPSQGLRDPSSDQNEAQRPSQARRDPLSDQYDLQRPSQAFRDPPPGQYEMQRPSQVRRDPSSDQNEAQRPSQARRDPLFDQYDARPSQGLRDPSSDQNEAQRPSQARRDPLSDQYDARPSQGLRDPSSDQNEAQRPSQVRRDPLSDQYDPQRPSQAFRDPPPGQYETQRPSQVRRDPSSDQNEAQRPSQAFRDPPPGQYEAQRPSQARRDQLEQRVSYGGSPKRRAQPEDRDDEKQFEVESPSRDHIMSPAQLLSDDNMTGRTDTSAAHPSRPRRPKKYFVYCEIPKILIGDYRNSSVICSEIIHAHFLMKIAKDEEFGQPQLQPIRRYHRPKVNFAVIHRSLIVDEDAIGPIPRSPNVKSPMIKEDDEFERQAPRLSGDHIMHATMGFCYGRLPRSKYELLTQWSLEPDNNGVHYPELVLSKAEG